MCDANYNLWHFVEPPFVTASNGSTIHGLVYEAVMQSLSACCPTVPQLKPRLFHSQDKMLSSIKSGNVIAFPVSFTSTMLLNSPTYFIRVVEAPGMSLIAPMPAPTGNMFIQGMHSVIPLVLFITLMTGYAGLILWLAELTGNPPDRQIPKPFLRGYVESCYCALVTATTVGYGDCTPKTYSGKAFIMLWTFFGLAIMSVFTASMTTVLTSEQVELNRASTLPIGQKIGVIRGSLARHLVIQAGAYPKEGDNFTVLHEMLHDDEISAILMNQYFCSFVASHVAESFEIDHCRTGAIITGFILYSEAKGIDELRECLNEYHLFRAFGQDHALLELLIARNSSKQKPTDLATSSIKGLVSEDVLTLLSCVLVALLLSVLCFDQMLKILVSRGVIQFCGTQKQPQKVMVEEFEKIDPVVSQ